MIELRHLRYFLTVAEELHFARAAARLHISQPPLSRQIQQLEQHLGVTLLQRSQRRVALTEAGAVFREEVQKLFGQLQQAEQRTQMAARGEYGQLRVGFISTAIYSVLPKLLKTFSERYPNVELVLHELTGDAQLQALQEERIDVGIMMPSEHIKNLLWQPLYREPLILVLASAHPLAQLPEQRPVEVKDLNDEIFILFPRELAPALFDKIIGVAERAGFNLKIGQRAVQMQTIISLVSANLGIALVPACMQALQRSDVVYRQLTPQSAMIETAITWRLGDSSAVLASFLGICSEITSYDIIAASLVDDETVIT